MLNETHDPQLRSWVDSANTAASDFPLQNLPFGVFRPAGSREPFRCGVAIGEQILDLRAALRTDALQTAAAGNADAMAIAVAALSAATALNAFMSAGPQVWSTLRRALSRALRAGSRLQALLQSCLLPRSQAEFALPAHIGDYTDFYASIYHATAVGRLFRPDQPLLPNYRWVPVGYHGRCSSIGVSGQRFVRPLGQTRAADASAPTLGPSRRIDYELELGIFIGVANAAGVPVDIGTAETHVFGLCLLNDWSARDLQSWEAQPLGPFLAKNFATTISPWIVTLEALEPYRLPWTRPAQDPPPLPYLDSPALRRAGAIDIELEAALQTPAMQRAGQAPQRLSLSNFRHCYWSIAQLVTHHTVNGCNLRSGDLLGTGTQSGPVPQEAGSLLELTQGGRLPITLPDGETRSFLQDGDTLILRGWCARPGAARLGFGEARGGPLGAVRREAT
jgi:fumarylacetoacetase